MKNIVWKRQDIGSGDMLIVTTEVTVDGLVTVDIPLSAYQRLVQWASLSRTIDSVLSDDVKRREIGVEELQELRVSLQEIHDTIRRRRHKDTTRVEG